MLRTVAFVLPVLIPSWRFFKSIEPSPRLEWAPVSGECAPTEQWQEFRPRPAHVSTWQMLFCLFWNPDRNADLFHISCAERIQSAPTQHSIDTITRSLQFDVAQGRIDPSSDTLMFRLTFVHREGSELVKEVVFQSGPFPSGRP